MAVKVSSKVSTQAQSKQSAKKEAVKLVSVPSQVSAAFNSAASAWKAGEVAATAKEQSIVKLGQLVGNTMGKNPREVTRASIAAPFAKAFREANNSLNTGAFSAAKPHPRFKDETALNLYIGQQLSRVLSIAYPGGASATPAEAKAAAQDLAKALNDPKVKQDQLYKVANRSLQYKAGKLIEVRSHNRGGHNKAKPADAARAKAKDYLSSGKQARLSAAQLLMFIVDAGVDLDLWQDSAEAKDLL